jgi:hypothetical protein
VHYGLMHVDDAGEQRMRRALQRLGSYDRILLCPWGVLPLRDDGVRSPNRWAQFQFQSVVEALLASHAPAGRVLRVPPTDDLRARIDVVRTRLRR